MCLLKNESTSYKKWQVKILSIEAKVKASLKKTFVVFYRPEPEWSIHDQDEI